MTNESEDGKIIHGYLRSLHQSLSDKHVFHSLYDRHDIPVGIQQICLSFYHYPTIINTEINKQVYPSLFSFDPNTNTIKSSYTDPKCTISQITCLIGNVITNKMCKRVRIDIKWPQRADDSPNRYYRPWGHGATFMMGFMNGEYDTNKLVKTDFDLDGWVYLGSYTYGRIDNHEISKGIRINDKRNHFIVFGQDGTNQVWTHEQYRASNNLQRNDEFSICVDFVKDEYYVYHNDKFAFKLSLQGWKSIIFGVTIMEPEDSIQVKGWQFWKH